MRQLCKLCGGECNPFACRFFKDQQEADEFQRDWDEAQRRLEAEEKEAA